MRRLPGVLGVDVLLDGGLEPGSVVVLAGAPGTGKTILAQQLCFASGTTDHHAVYYTTVSEPNSKLVRHIEQFDFFVPDALEERVEYLHAGDLLRRGESGGVEAFFAEVIRKTIEEKPAVVVIDSAKALRDFIAERPLREALYDLTSRLGQTETVLVLVGEYAVDEVHDGVEFALADGIIHLEYEPREPVDRRWLRVVKMRGRAHWEGKHTFRVGAGGIEVFPRIENLDPGQPAEVTGRIGTGLARLDELMGGGLGSGEATVVVGPSGVGKTIFGLRFVVEGLRKGERCLYVTFQDTPQQLIKMAAGFGWDLQEACERGQLSVRHVPLGDLDLDMLANGVRTELASGDIARVVIDSLAEMADAARETSRFPAFTRSLIGFIRAAGASLVISSELTTLGPPREPAGGIMFLFHNLIFMRYIELESASGRALNVVKMRNSDHDKHIYQFEIGPTGMMIGERLEGVVGVLGWSALQALGRLL